MATVKFLHPGAQWTSQPDQGTASWTTVEQGHARRHLQTDGQFLRSPGGPLEEGQLGFWSCAGPGALPRCQDVVAGG